jgi:protoporphyrinogen oxidase
VTAAEWIKKHQGAAVYRNIWGPLLHQKYSHMADEVAMVWLWGKLHLRGRSRSRSGLGERLGYMRGSFGRLTEELGRRIDARGGQIHLGEAVQRIERSGEGFELRTRKRVFPADRVIMAGPVSDYLEIAGHLLTSEERTTLGELKATGAICTVLELDRSLSPYYWLNIADPEMPFGGLIEHTNYIPAERYGGRIILYVSNYLFSDDPLFSAPKKKVLDAYLPALQRINPSFDASWIQASHHYRADDAQPVVTRGYRQRLPAMRSSVPGLYLCTMAQIYPEDRGQNYAVAYADKVVAKVVEDLETSS